MKIKIKKSYKIKKSSLRKKKLKKYTRASAAKLAAAIVGVYVGNIIIQEILRTLRDEEQKKKENDKNV